MIPFQLPLRDINLELTNVCNFDCVYCPNSEMTRKKGFMRFETVKEIVDDIHKNNITKVINLFVMGEPLLHKEIVAIVRYIEERGIKAKVNTNAGLLNNNLASDLYHAGLSILYISLNTPTPETFKHRRSKGVEFSKWINNIRDAIDLKFHEKAATRIIISVLKTQNEFINDIKKGFFVSGNNDESVAILKEWEVFFDNVKEKYNLTIPPKTGAAVLKKHMANMFSRVNYTFSPLPDVAFNITRLHNWKNSLANNKIKTAVFGSCDALRETISILYNGDYSLCCGDYDGKLVVGNVKDQKLSEFLFSEKANLIRNKFQHNQLPTMRCKKCRGGSSSFFWLFNQTHSSLFYNSVYYRKFRKFIGI